jgi:hypothetical protein
MSGGRGDDHNHLGGSRRWSTARGKIMAEREGFEPDSDPLSDQQVVDSENNLVPGDPPKTP